MKARRFWVRAFFCGKEIKIRYAPRKSKSPPSRKLLGTLLVPFADAGFASGADEASVPTQSGGDSHLGKDVGVVESGFVQAVVSSRRAAMTRGA